MQYIISSTPPLHQLLYHTFPISRTSSSCAQHSYSGKAIDVWALGVTLFALVYGNVPFYADNVPALYDRIRRDSLAFSVTTTTTTSTADGTGCLISDELRQLILAMLDKDPATRITLPQIKVYCLHLFI